MTAATIPQSFFQLSTLTTYVSKAKRNCAPFPIMLHSYTCLLTSQQQTFGDPA